MHEWALAEAVVSTAIKVAKEQGLREITEIKIKLGQLQQIEKEIFEFALREVIQPQKSLLSKAKIEFQTEKAILKCRACEKKWMFADTIKKLSQAESESIHFIPETAQAYIRCPRCKSPDFEVVRGRGVWIDSISGQGAA